MFVENITKSCFFDYISYSIDPFINKIYLSKYMVKDSIDCSYAAYSNIITPHITNHYVKCAH